jgi:hypothetical protein
MAVASQGNMSKASPLTYLDATLSRLMIST